MPSTISRRRFSDEFAMSIDAFSVDHNFKDASGLLNFDDPAHLVPVEHDQLLFGDMDDVQSTTLPSTVPFPWAPSDEMDIKPFAYAAPHSLSTYEYGPAQASPTDSYFDSPDSRFYTPDDAINSPSYDSNLFIANWVNDPEPSSSSSPIAIPSPIADISLSQFIPYASRSHFPQEAGAFSPSDFAALHPLPGSFSPSSSFEDPSLLRDQSESLAASPPHESSLHVPGWASELWETSPPEVTKPLSPQPRRRSPLSVETTHRLRAPTRRDSLSSSGPSFISASAPTFSPITTAARHYTRKAESPTSTAEDRDATVRRRRKISAPEELQVTSKMSDNAPLKSVLKTPKLAPSAWQLYFTDWIQRQQASNTRKLNVAQAAKEAGQEYASLSAEEKEPYKRKSQQLKEARERDLASYMRTLSPEDIKRENAFRAAQRKAGKSRKSNMKDPNAPKKPLSAYFMFLQRIRANPLMVQDVFGDETETTKQSVLAAAKWRAMTDDERKPFLAQAEQEKMEYEAARKLYEEGPSGLNTSFNFSILPGSPGFASLKVESESESEIDGLDRRNRF